MDLSIGGSVFAITPCGSSPLTLMAAFTLAGTGATTYTLPVSVCVVVRSRHRGAVAPLEQLARVEHLDLVQRVVPVLVVAVGELGGRLGLA